MATIFSLCADVLMLILSQCSIRDIIAFTLTNRQFYQLRETEKLRTTINTKIPHSITRTTGNFIQRYIRKTSYTYMVAGKTYRTIDKTDLTEDFAGIPHYHHNSYVTGVKFLKWTDILSKHKLKLGWLRSPSDLNRWFTTDNEFIPKRILKILLDFADGPIRIDFVSFNYQVTAKFTGNFKVDGKIYNCARYFFETKTILYEVEQCKFNK